MKSVLAAERAILLQLKSVGIVFLVLGRVIVSLLALGANERDLDSCVISHISGTSHYKLLDNGVVPYLPLGGTGLSLSGWRTGTTKKPAHRGN